MNSKNWLVKFIEEWYKKRNLHTPLVENEKVANRVDYVKRGNCLLIHQLEEFFQKKYRFRYNLLTEMTEFIRQDSLMEKYYVLTKRELNTICLEAREQGLNCWDRDIIRYIESDRISTYHPFHDYMGTLPLWDGKDRVSELAVLVSQLPLWINGFHRWMLAAVAQWMRPETQYANAVAPILVSHEHGRGKSAFCKSLLPPELIDYCTESFDCSDSKSSELKMAEHGLIILDEFDKISAKKMGALKNLLQMSILKLRKAHQRNYRHLPRIASFIGTSNFKELLTDPTGSRRFLCVDVENTIPKLDIDHKQLYAQLKTEIESGERYWFSKDEERAIQKNNRAFCKLSTEESLLRECFAPASDDEGVKLTAAQILRIMKRKHPGLLKDATLQGIGMALVAMGVKKLHRKDNNYYQVVELK